MNIHFDWKEQEKTIGLFSTRLILKQMCILYSLLGFRLHLTLIFLVALSNSNLFPFHYLKIWYNCLLHFALHNRQVENYLLSVFVVVYTITARKDWKGFCWYLIVRCDTQWTITVFQPNTITRLLFVSSHLIPSHFRQ